MRVQAIIKRIMKQFIRDKRTLALLLVAPMFILSLMYLVFSYNEPTPNVGIANAPTIIHEALDTLEIPFTIVTVDEGNTLLESSQIDALIDFSHPKPTVVLEGSDPAKNMMVLQIVQKISQLTMSGAIPGAAPSTLASPLPETDNTLDVTYLYGSANMSLFDSIGPILIGFFIFFFVFIIAGVSFLRERTTGTLERLLATPLRRWEIVLGYVIGFGIFTTFQASLISWYSISVLNIMMEGTFLYVILITFLLAMSALTLGTLLSAFANNELQMIQFIPIIIVPQVFFCGLFDLTSMPSWLRSIGSIMPLTYGADALRDIMIRGNGWESISTNVLILVAFSLVFMFLNVFALKKHRAL
ncbi:ABC transporter permease [Desulfuribacillus stibiiarsenatis]|uniref:ABC transporter permease n=1 Tax=Desulfuribacillus stibiiarsenatis TaxID=1390249 RepID=A0A1E5L531_9FIRM|nr:ABC transporter permease [Desulfuribacillus stibiiarsenatis]OEH85272.1 ABC transporter permease [Desulfuribacillus stibiiarsenatis]